MTLLVMVNNDDIVVSMQPGVACESVRDPCTRHPDHVRFVLVQLLWVGWLVCCLVTRMNRGQRLYRSRCHLVCSWSLGQGHIVLDRRRVPTKTESSVPFSIFVPMGMAQNN